MLTPLTAWYSKLLQCVLRILLLVMSWQVNLGEGRGVHQLQVDTRLTFGRNTDCDIVVKVRSECRA